MKKTLLSATGITFRRRKNTILDKISLALYPNEVVALIGGNGTGKTTLLEILIGRIQPDGGQIHHSEHLKPFWLGYLPDKAPFYPDWRVLEFLESCAKMRGVTAPQKAAQTMLQTCHLQTVAQKKCSALSHGFRQRLGLAQALIHQPEVVILDEPTNGLDTTQKTALRPLLAGLKTQCSVLLTSHDWEEVLAVADRVYELSAGFLREIPLPPRTEQQLWAECDAPATAATLATIPDLLDGRFVGFHHDGSPAARRQLWQQLSRTDGVIQIHAHYPREALQEKLHHVA